LPASGWLQAGAGRRCLLRGAGWTPGGGWTPGRAEAEEQERWSACWAAASL